MVPLRFSPDDVRGFAAWSGDANPLHVDEAFARQTHFGRPIVHGVLTVLRALDASPPSPRSLTGLDVEFRGAVTAGAEYVTRCDADGAVETVTLHDAGQLALSVRCETTIGVAPPPDAAWLPSAAQRPPRTEPASHALEEFGADLEVRGAYPWRAPQQLMPSSGVLSATQARVLALCSYLVGMEVPGRSSLFTRLTVRFHADAGPAPDLCYRARTARFDRAFRLLDTDVDVVTTDGRLVATARLRSYVPFSPVVTNLEALAAQIAIAGDSLRDKVALVIGGSRGLGADLTAALALAGCHVYASARHDDDARREAHRRLTERGGRVAFLAGDAGDADWCQAALDRIVREQGRLDVLVLNACAPPSAMRLSRESAARHEQYVRENLRLVETPLTLAIPALQASAGTVVCVSSSYVDDTPPGFSHYVSVKQAAEGLVRTLVREQAGMSALIVRPPTLQTRWNDTPAGVVGTIPAHWVAAHVVRDLATSRPAERVALRTEFPGIDVPSVESPVGAPPELSLRVVASFTTDTLVPALRFWVKTLGLDAGLEAAPYGQVLQSLLDPSSALNARGKGLNVVLVRVLDWLRELADGQAADQTFARQHLLQTARDLNRALRAHRAQASVDTLLIVCPSPDSADADEVDARAQAEAEMLAGLGEVPGLQVVSAADAHARYGVDAAALHDPLRDHIAHIPYRDDYIYVLATLAMRHLHRRLGPAHKVVVVDCDNTLWRGVVGEVGAEGVAFDEGHWALHETLARLSGEGVLVCLCSKNEEADVWRVFETRDELRLRRENVVAAMINWLPKSQNIRALAARLNLGLDSFVFLDDNPVECAEVRSGCPDVLTVQWPQDAARARLLVDHLWEFDARSITKEDARRTELYRQEFKRQELRTGALTFEQFILDLQLVVEAEPLVAADMARAAQLTLRTNQFNFTTIRRSEAELQALIDGGCHDVRTVRVRDRFGDYGLVGLVIAERGADAWRLDTFLLSCRVLGRGAEHRILADVGRSAAASGARTVLMRLDTTKRNTPARAFLESVVPPDQRLTDAGGIACEVPSEVLAATHFDPATGGDVAVPEDAPGDATAAAPVDASRLRRREQEIERTAYELSTGAALVAAALGRPLASTRTMVPSDTGDVARAVRGAFADALRVSPERVAEVDELEALGCDSLRIVEITVALTATFPRMPSTLLFEHRTVTEIVREVLRLAAPEAGAVPGIPAAARRDPVSRGDIAVVGMHLRCAGAHSPGELWQLLSSGRSGVTPVPVDRPQFLQPLSDARPHWAGLLDGVAQFDAEHFGVSPREAEFMDPQLRLFLEVAWGALEDAGLAGAGHEPETGVFAGVMYGDYGFRANLASARTPNPYRCWEGFSLANRLSQLLGFHGPSLAVDTACSSSGTAIHLACAALNAGDCRVAVVGGVNLILDPDRFGSLGRLGILSASGRCEPFGADADGTVLGEGAGVVILRPLDDAVQRGDRIYGVIKGTGLSTGSGTVGFTAPNPQAQAHAIRRAVEAARIDPRTISYVETHGTGTQLGDPIEVRGLMLAYGTPELADRSLTLTPRCAIGSIKPNIGHLEAGAGVLGLIKVLLQLAHRQLLPSTTSARPNPQIPFAQGPFDVQRTLADWTRPEGQAGGRAVTLPRRAGLSSFGVGGANAHVIVEEAPDPPSSPDVVDRPAHVLTLSARTEQGLRHQARRLAEHVEQETEASIGAMCFSLNTGRRHASRRLALVAAGRDELLPLLRDAAEGVESARVSRGEAARAPKIAFLFTGQGSQFAGMGRELYETQPVFRAAIDRCAATLDPLLDHPLVALICAAEGSAAAGRLHQTGCTQPALFAFEYALSQLWQSWGVHPDIVIGHSVGEIAALCVAGGVSLADGLTLVAARGRLMQALPEGGVMTSVMADEARVRDALRGASGAVSIAAINAPGHVVISGAGVAVAEVIDRLAADGVKTRALTVSHAFHSPLMAPMLADYERVVRGMRFTRPRVPIVSGVNGVTGGDELLAPDYWVRQVMDPVRFAAGARTLEAAGVTACIEVGPQPVLLGLARQSVVDDTAIDWLPSQRKDADGSRTLLASLARLYVRGAEVDWLAFDAPYGRRRVTVPPFAFAQREYWLRRVPGLEAALPMPVGAALPVHGPQHYALEWRPQAGLAPPAAAKGHWLVFADGHGVGAALADTLRARGAAVSIVRAADAFGAIGPGAYQLSPSRADDLPRLWQAATLDHPLDRVVYLWGLDARAFEDALTTHVSMVTGLLQAIARGGRTAPARVPQVWVVTGGAIELAEGTPAAGFAAAGSALWGFGRTAALEYPDAWGGLIDVALGDTRSAADALATELCAGGPEDQIALRAEGRRVARLVRAPEGASSPVPVLRADGVYLITGGTGALGLHVARWLVARGARHVALVSRRGVVDAGGRGVIQQLETAGATIDVIPADVGRAADVDAVFARLAAAPWPLRGVVHAAGLDASVPIDRLTGDDIRSVLGGKAVGGWLLHERTRTMALDFFIGFSSMASVLGAQGRAHYGAANAVLDAIIAERRRLGLAGTSINWGPWRDGGMAGADQLQQFERIGNRGLDPAQAVAAMGEAVASGAAQVMVADIDWATFAPIFEARRARPVIADIAEPQELPVGGAVAADGWIPRLRALPVSERRAALGRLLRGEVAETLGFESPDSVPTDRSFYEIGMDSLMMADLVGRLKARVGVSCTSLVFDHPNVEGLASRMIERLPLEDGIAAPVASPPAPSRSTRAGMGIGGYSPEVESEAIAFQVRAWPQRDPELIPLRWRWMFLESARRLGVEPRLWLHRDAGALVGHMGSIPVRLKTGADERLTGWLVDTMVLEAYRSRAAGSRIMVQAHEDAPFSLSLGQTAEMREIQVRLGWTQVAPLQIAQRLVRPGNVLKGKVPGPAAWAVGLGARASDAVWHLLADQSVWQTAAVARFDERHDALWAAAADDLTCAVVRDASYLNWKYVDQPGQRFLRVAVSHEGVLQGVAVWMIREADRHYRYRRAFLVDVVTRLSDAAGLEQVIRAACAAAAEAAPDSLLCHHIDARLTRALKACGFHLRAPERFLLVDPGGLDGPARERVLSPESWFVTHGDSDIDRPW